MRNDKLVKGPERAPHRSLLYAMGWVGEKLTSLEQSACPGCGSCAIFKEVDVT